MAVPNRPAAGGVVESGWGQVVHDTAVAQDIQMGTVSTVHASVQTSPTVQVTFPRPFAAPPMVAIASGNFNYSVGLAGAVPTATGFQVASWRFSGAATGTVVSTWVAIGPRA
jgi:hypothetical protein